MFILQSKDYEVMPMMSPDQEEYTCYIPRQHIEAQVCFDDNLCIK